MENTPSIVEPQSAQSESTITLFVSVGDDAPDREVSITPAQQRALECLFEGGSITNAASHAGVARQTINRWIRNSLDFRTVYEAWQRELQRSVKDRLTALSDAAIDNIADAVRHGGDLRMSQFVIKHLISKKET